MVSPIRNRVIAFLAIVLCFAGFSLPAQAADSCPAAGFVRSAGQAYDRAAASGSPAAFASAADRYSDLRSLSLFALGKYRKDLPKSREAEYLRLTRQFIGKLLKTHGGGFRGGALEILDCSGSGSDYVVKARAASGSKVTFRVSRAGGGYTVRDVNMQGVWLGQQMRNKFTSTISRTGSIDGLFAYLGG